MSIKFSSEEVLEMAIKIEELGEDYYREFANKASSSKIKELFNFLADEEVKHKNTFLNLQKKLGKNDLVTPMNIEEVSAYLKSVVGYKVFEDKNSFLQKFKDVKDPIEIIDNAISFEKDTILYYLEMKEFVKENNKKVLENLISEEKKHILKLEEVKKELD